ncbi:CYTH domain-containing protein [Candidatus Woesearchaeota archaeon]|nr:CYTH domain-containing protein [Candidatus Woesearchaeota archaeon]
MEEVEVKILDIDKKKIERKLLELGAEKVFEGKVDAVYFDDGSLGKGKTLRLRKLGDKVQLTYKENISRTIVKRVKEEETYLDDFDEALREFKALGFKMKRRIKKTRITYKLKDAKKVVTFEIDKFSSIPYFLEIESEEKLIFKYAKLLGFKRSQLKPWTGKDVFKHYGKFS